MKQLALALTLLASSAFSQEGVTTLYAHDPLTRTLCFTDGGAGAAIQAGAVFNRCSHLAFDSSPDRFVIGVQGGEQAAITDLGTSEELAKRYSYPETVGGGQGYASLAISDSLITIRSATPQQAPQRLLEQQRLNTLKSGASASITPGHIMISRLHSRRDGDLFVKFIVLAHVPGQSVTIRWAVLRPGA